MAKDIVASSFIPVSLKGLELSPNLPTDELGWMQLALAKRGEAANFTAQIQANSERTALGNAVQVNDEYIRIGQMAKQLGIGQTTYLEELRECKIIMPSSRLPYQRYMQYFKVTQLLHDGKYEQAAMINPKGQTYLTKRHLEHRRMRSTRDALEMAIESALV